MTEPLRRSDVIFLTVFRVVCWVCALYFLAMGLTLMLVPAFVCRIAGPQDPIILGMLRGAGGSIIPYALLYLIVARSPLTRRWGVVVIGVANMVSIGLDSLSVHIGEYRLVHAMFDIPVEVLSLLLMVLLLVRFAGRSREVVGEGQ